MRALACPSSLKGVLSARDAASALAKGLREWADADELPIADGGEGTLDVLQAALGGAWREASVHDAFGRPQEARWLVLPDGTAAVEAAQAIPLDPSRLDVMHASSRGLGELLHAVGRPRGLLVCLGGTATVDGGAGMREVAYAALHDRSDLALTLAGLRRYPAHVGDVCDALNYQYVARLGEIMRLEFGQLPGAGAAGGLGAALAALGSELGPGSSLVLELIGFEPRVYDLVVTGEGTVDATTMRGKAVGEVAKRCLAERVRCVVFGGRVIDPVPAVETVPLSGDRSRARADLTDLGARLARSFST